MGSGKRATVWLTLFVLMALGAACAKTQETTAPAATWKASGNEGNLVGTISFTGAVPAPRKMEMSQDPACEKLGEAFLDDIVVSHGKLQNAFVFVKSDLLRSVAFETPTAAVTLDQKGCKYAPRVLGLQTGQPLKIINSDPTDHNIHPVPKINKEWNQSQIVGQGPIIRKFTQPETLIQVKCNKHPWMVAWVGVLPHPFFAVSNSDGSFAIKGLPPGEYEVEAWHEKYGAKTMKVKVAEKADAKADFTFGGAMSLVPSTLKMQPGTVIP